MHVQFLHRRDLFWKAIRWENIAENQYSKWMTQLEEKWLNFVVLEYNRAWYFHFIFDGSSTSITYSETRRSFYYVIFTNIKAKE